MSKNKMWVTYVIKSFLVAKLKKKQVKLNLIKQYIIKNRNFTR